jgi:hypothetical protein
MIEDLEQGKILKNSWFPPALLTLLASILPSFYLYANNAFEVPLKDVALPMAISAAMGLLLFWVLFAIFKNPALAGLIASLCMTLFLNFNFIVFLVDLVVKGVRVRVYYFTAVGILLLLLALLLLIHKKGWSVLLSRFFLIVCGVMLALNVVTAVPQASRRLNATSFAVSDQAKKQDKTLPNLYYLIADEYASFQEIQKYYGYDNSAFHRFLTQRGFCVSDESYNHGGGTMQNMADNVNLAQVASNSMEYADYVELFNNGILYGELENLGYDLSQLGSLYPLPKLLMEDSFSIAGDATTMNGESAAEILLGNSMLMPLKTMLYWRTINASGDLAVFDYLEDPAHYENVRNRAVFLYICSPHPPFYYEADGTEIEDSEKWTDWADTSLYLGQFQYITTRLEKTISAILENDPNAIILLQSDHGLRYHEDSDRPHTFMIEEKDQRRILNALYFCGEKVDITGLSGYNTWRTVLSRLGLPYPVLSEDEG